MGLQGSLQKGGGLYLALGYPGLMTMSQKRILRHTEVETKKAY
jgi:hypothetical protein